MYVFLDYISRLSGWKIFLIMLFLLLIIDFIYIYFTQFEKEITIDEKYTYGGKGISQSVSDKENNVYLVRNSIFYLHWESIEVFNQMNMNSKYKVSGYGIRIPILGTFPIIIHADEV